MRDYKKFYLKFDEGHQKWTLRGQILKNKKAIDDDRLIRFDSDDIDESFEKAQNYLAENKFDSAKIQLPKNVQLKAEADATSIREEAEEDLQATWND